jgi:hypothetical protein
MSNVKHSQQPEMEASIHTRTEVIVRLKRHSSKLDDLLSSTKLDAIAFAQVLQTLIYAQQEIRRLSIEEKHHHTTNTQETPSLFGDDRS